MLAVLQLIEQNHQNDYIETQCSVLLRKTHEYAVKYYIFSKNSVCCIAEIDQNQLNDCVVTSASTIAEKWRIFSNVAKTLKIFSLLPIVDALRYQEHVLIQKGAGF